MNKKDKNITESAPGFKSFLPTLNSLQHTQKCATSNKVLIIIDHFWTLSSLDETSAEFVVKRPGCEMKHIVSLGSKLFMPPLLRQFVPSLVLFYFEFYPYLLSSKKTKTCMSLTEYYILIDILLEYH